MTNVEAAEEMGIGAETVKSYLRSVMRKLVFHISLNYRMPLKNFCKLQGHPVV